MASAGDRPSRRDERKEETRRELLASAAQVFAESGFHAASLDRIAREAGYTTGAIYWHFEGKDGLFLAAFEEYALTRVGEIGDAHAHAAGTLPKRQRALADQWMGRQQDPGFMIASLEFLAHAWRKPALREALAARHAAVRLALGRLLAADAADAGVELPLPAEEVATALRELGVGLALARIADPDAIPQRLFGDFVESYYDLVLDSAGKRR